MCSTIDDLNLSQSLDNLWFLTASLDLVPAPAAIGYCQAMEGTSHVRQTCTK